MRIQADKEKVLLLTSGAYANSEITSDFGLLPTAFLPVGHKRLFELQINLFKNKNVIKFITLPSDYILLERDESFLKNSKVNVERVNPNLSLAASILEFYSRFEDFLIDKELYILHGDTLFNYIDLEPDILYYNYSDMFYKWGDLEKIIGNNYKKIDKKQAIISGFFSFGDPMLFKEKLKETGVFELALSKYNLLQVLKCKIGEGWLDFGHANLYFKSKMKLNVTRVFNKNVANKNFINKSSHNKRKILSEYNWFVEIPDHLRLYTPHVWDYRENEKSSSYNIEFVGAPTIQEKWVFGNLPEFTYDKIIDNVFDLISLMGSIKADHINESIVKECLEGLYITKTKKRITDFCDQLNFSINTPLIINGKKYPSLKEFSTEILKAINAEVNNEKSFSLMHGDLCFSNILYDTRSDLIKVIDPRGGLNYEFDSGHYIYGDYRYDIAKLGHSIVGNYDNIVTGFYKLSVDLSNYNFEFYLEHEKKDKLENYFYKKVEEVSVSKEFIKASITNLFVSMLALHNDDKNRQIALLLNAYIYYYN